MDCDPGPLPQLAVAVLVLGATTLVIRRAGFSMLASQAPVRTPRFWWMLAAFLGPLGIANRLLFCDGLFLQLAVVTLVAGTGIWAADRVASRFGSGRG